MLKNKSKMIIAVAVMLTPLFLQGDNIYGWEFAAVGDIECTDAGRKVADGMKATAAEVHILLGDIGYGQEQCVFDYFQEGGVKILAACGNHDDCAKIENYSGHSNTFGYAHKNVAFQLVNTESSISAQNSSIESNFKKWQSDPNIDTIVVVQHKATITNPSAHHSENETKGYREFYGEMKERYQKFSLLLQAHNHAYQICEPDSPDIRVLTDGTGGMTPYPWGSLFDDNCNVNLSGPEYNGFSLFKVTDKEISGRHFSIENEEFSEGF